MILQIQYIFYFLSKKKKKSYEFYSLIYFVVKISYIEKIVYLLCTC